MAEVMRQTADAAIQPKKRQANYELLRIIAMLMVVTLHYLNHTGMLPVPGEAAGAGRIMGMLMESFCIVAVNVYVLISGYFLVEAGFKVKRVLVLICQILFYALLIPLIMTGTGMFHGEGGIYGLISYFLPIQTEHYWFATAYVLMYLFTPILNIAVKNMSKQQLQITLGGLLLFFCVGKSLLPIQLVTDRFGYDFGWFLCVYLVAAYLRLYGLETLRTAGRAWTVYAGCGLLIFGTGLAAYLINRKTGGLAYAMSLPFHYNFVFCLLGAVALFTAFGHIRIKNEKAAEWICRISPLTFGVYLFHEHINIRNEWAGWIEDFIGPVARAGIGSLLVHWAISVLLVYTAGIFVDAIRAVVFRYVGRYLGKTRLAGWIDRLDGAFAKRRSS